MPCRNFESAPRRIRPNMGGHLERKSSSRRAQGRTLGTDLYLTIFETTSWTPTIGLTTMQDCARQPNGRTISVARWADQSEFLDCITVETRPSFSSLTKACG